jgi:hypothetical protein
MAWLYFCNEFIELLLLNNLFDLLWICNKLLLLLWWLDTASLLSERIVYYQLEYFP